MDEQGVKNLAGAFIKLLLFILVGSVLLWGLAQWLGSRGGI